MNRYLLGGEGNVSAPRDTQHRFFHTSLIPNVMQAIWNGTVIAESDTTIVVEGNHYFPPDAIKEAHFEKSSHHTTCPWKGEASYYDVVVAGDRNANAAWYYPQPKDAAAKIKDYVAFWKGVTVQAS